MQSSTKSQIKQVDAAKAIPRQANGTLVISYIKETDFLATKHHVQDVVMQFEHPTKKSSQAVRMPPGSCCPVRTVKEMVNLHKSIDVDMNAPSVLQQPNNAVREFKRPLSSLRRKNNDVAAPAENPLQAMNASSSSQQPNNAVKEFKRPLSSLRRKNNDVSTPAENPPQAKPATRGSLIAFNDEFELSQSKTAGKPNVSNVSENNREFAMHPDRLNRNPSYSRGALFAFNDECDKKEEAMQTNQAQMNAIEDAKFEDDLMAILDEKKENGPATSSLKKNKTAKKVKVKKDRQIAEVRRSSRLAAN